MTGESMCVCHRPLRDTLTVCDECLDQVAKDLESVATLVDELLVTLTRQDRIGTSDGRGQSETPVPFHPRASDRIGSLVACLYGWARLIADGRGMNLDCGRNPAALAGWILPSLVWCQTHADTPRYVIKVADEVKAAYRTIDRPADKWYAGPCSEPVDGAECPGELYARPGAMTVTCRVCTARHDVAERRRWLLDAAEDYLAPIEQLAAALTSWGEPVKPERLRQWVTRGRLITHGLHEPDSVKVATQAYETESDTVGRFVEDVCNLGDATSPAYRVQVAKLRAEYEKWCRIEGEEPVSPKALTQALKGRFNVTSQRTMHSRFYSGISVNELSSDEPNPSWGSEPPQQEMGW